MNDEYSDLPQSILCPACHGFGGDGGPDVCEECEGFGEIEDPNYYKSGKEN